MTRTLIFLGLLTLAGCERQPPEDPPPTSATAVPAAPPGPQPKFLPSGEIDFAGWPAATEKPYPVAPATSSLCAVVGFDPRAGADKLHGPHFQPAIVVRTNPEAMSAFRESKSPMPVGTVVVKEKHAMEAADAPPAEYGAMVKREPGYDPGHGDWEYLYVTRKPVLMITRGKVTACIACHEKARETDYLFRTYLPGTNPGEW